MRFNRDCANFAQGHGQPIVHAGPEGIHSERPGACRLDLINIGGCPPACPCYTPKDR